METWTSTGGRWRRDDTEGPGERWYHLCGTGSGELEALAQRFGLHPLSVEDTLSANLHTPKVDEFSDHLFIVVLALIPDDGPLPRLVELDAFLGADFLITQSDIPIPEILEVEQLIEAGRTVRPGIDGLFYEIVDRIVDGILPEVDGIAEQLDAIEDAVLADPRATHDTHQVVKLRAEAGRYRRLLSPQIALMQRLSRGEFAVISEPNRIYFRDIYDHMVRADIALESVREDAEVVLSTYLSAANNRMSEVMKVLSAVAALALPATVISGIFGTNFDNVPGLHSSWGFAFMMAAMAGVAGGMALLFHRRGWF